MIGQTVSHYKILDKLGEGGMGEVYLAEDTSLGRKVAVKFLSSGKAIDPESRKRFIHEARAQALVAHPNVATFHEVGEERGKVFIVMEYIEGQKLSELAKTEKLSLSEILDLAIQVGEGLQAAHEKGVMHRDINPTNILVTAKRVAKITDFGLAKWKGASTITRTGLQMGTDHYMSPEEVEGKKADFRTDIFSLGAVLYELICARRPFEGTNRESLFYEILYTPPPPLARYSREASENLERIVLKCLAKKPEERYQSAADLVADLKTLKKSSEIGIVPLQLAFSTGKQKRVAGKWLKVGVATGPAIAILAMLYLFTRQGEAIHSIVVLPFVNASADSSLEYLSDGLTENLIFNLSQLPMLKVISRASAFTYKGRDIDAREVGSKLNVRAVLTGRMVPRGQMLSISVELMDTRQNTSLWGQRYNRKVTDIFAMQEEISRDISDKLRLRLTGKEAKTLTKRYTEDLEAYQLYLKGRFYWNKRSKDGFKKAEGYFKQAIEKDPAYALAYTGLAECYALFAEYDVFPPKESSPRADAAARKALEIDSSLAEAYNALAYVEFTYDWNFAASERDFRKTLELNPNYATAHQWYAEYLLAMGRFDEAMLEIKRAQELDPLSLIISEVVGVAFVQSRHYDQGIEQFKKTLELDPNFAAGNLWLGWTYGLKGMYDEAAATRIKFWELIGVDSADVAALRKAYDRAGWRGYLLKELDLFKEQSKHGYVNSHWFAINYAMLKENDRAFYWLQKGYEERAGWLPFLKVSSNWDSLRSDPRFTELLKKVGLEK